MPPLREERFRKPSRAGRNSRPPIHEVFRGQTVWQGKVEVFDLTGHPKAKRAYGWSHLDGKNDEEERFVTVLEIPPVESALTAVRVSIVADGKKRRNQEKN